MGRPRKTLEQKEKDNKPWILPERYGPVRDRVIAIKKYCIENRVPFLFTFLCEDDNGDEDYISEALTSATIGKKIREDKIYKLELMMKDFDVIESICEDPKPLEVNKNFDEVRISEIKNELISLDEYCQGEKIPYFIAVMTRGSEYEAAKFSYEYLLPSKCKKILENDRILKMAKVMAGYDVQAMAYVHSDIVF